MRVIIRWGSRIIAMLVFAILLNASRELYSLLPAILFNMVVGAILVYGVDMIDRMFRAIDRTRFMRETNINATQF